MPINFDQDYTPTQRRSAFTMRTNLSGVGTKSGSTWTSTEMDYMKNLVLEMAKIMFDSYQDGSLVTGGTQENTLDTSAIDRHNFLMDNDAAYVTRFLYTTDTNYQRSVADSLILQLQLLVYSSVDAAHHKWDPAFVATQSWLQDRKAEYDSGVSRSTPEDPQISLGATIISNADYGLVVTKVV